MSRRRLAATLAVAALIGCAAPEEGPLAARPYLVAVDPIGEEPRGTLTATVVVERDCVLLEDAEGLLLPLFAARTAFGPLDGGALTVDVGQRRLRIGDAATFEATTGAVTEGLRSRYPGVDLTRCGVRRYALVGEVTG